MECVDLSAAHGLKSLGGEAFLGCKVLRRVVLNDGLETIGEKCFYGSGLERLSVPKSVRDIGARAFCGSHLCSLVFEEGSRLSHVG